MGHHPRFIFGAQYYRAPTPEPACWAADLRRMRELGLESAKLWVQWRWSHRAPGRFDFSDLDQLMDLAAGEHLAVHLNLILDVAPTWLAREFPDCDPLLPDGRPVPPHEVSHRQLGGHPGPSYHHPGALAARIAFTRAAVAHFRGHPALAAWDVWNEPELGHPFRSPDPRQLLDYHPLAIAAFRAWLERRYRDIATLNRVWGRRYDGFAEVEAPRTGGCIGDFVDWRRFHADALAAEAAWRCAVVRELDPGRLVFLHVVPATAGCFNAVGTASDDDALLRDADVAAATASPRPWWAPHLASIAADRPVWNTEVHMDFGSASMHQRVLDLAAVRRELLPQIGGGVRGFQFWQLRSETLGCEAPAWGLLRPDGSDRPVATAIAAFWQRLRPHADAIADCPGPAGSAMVGVWRGDGNEIAHAAIHGDLSRHEASLDGWLEALHWRCLPVRMIRRGRLDGIRLLVMPQPYWLEQDEADAIAAWVEAGGTLLCDAHLAAYDGTRNRQSATVPGCGLAARFGLHEAESTSSFHLALGRHEQPAGGIGDDARKALAGTATGGRTYLLACADGGTLPAAERYAEIAGSGLEALAWLHPGRPVVAARRVRDGRVVYAGSDLGLAARLADGGGLDRLLGRVLADAGIAAPAGVATPSGARVRIDHLRDRAGVLRYAVAHNDGDAEAGIHLGGGGWHGVFDGAVIPPGGRTVIPPRSAELFAAP